MSDEHPTVGEIDRRRSKASPVHRGMDLRWIHMQRFACFACRKAFKQPGSQETWPPSAETRPFPCPDCGDVMIKMGRDFEVPRRNNKQAWLTVGCFGR